MEKYCSHCKKTKNVSEFHRRNFYSPLTMAGYRYICKPCDHIKTTEWRKKSGWISEKKRQGPGSKHAKQSKINSQRQRDEMSDMYISSLITKKSKTLNPEDIPKKLIEQYRISLGLKRELRKIKERNNGNK